jgi:hypothetical protein
MQFYFFFAFIYFLSIYVDYNIITVTKITILSQWQRLQYYHSDKDYNIISDKDYNIISDKDYNIISDKDYNIISDKDYNIISDKARVHINNILFVTQCASDLIRYIWGQ